MAKFDIKMRFKNYKLLKDKTFDLKGYHVLIIQGPNESGKTTARTALKENWQAKSLTKQPLTTGEEEGFVEITVPDKHGNAVIIKHDFNKFNQVGTFTAIDSDSKVIKSPGKMRELMGNYEHLSVQEVWALTQSLPGIRQLQENFLSQCLTKEERDSIKKIDLEIDTSNGTLFNERRLAKGEVDRLQKIIQSAPAISDEAIDAVNKLGLAKDNLKELKEELGNIDLVLQERTHIQKGIDQLLEEKNQLPETIKESNTLYDDLILKNEEIIKDYTKKINDFKLDNEKLIRTKEETNQEFDKQELLLSQQIEVEKTKLPSEPASRESLADRIERGEAFIEAASSTKISYEALKVDKEKAVQAAKILTDLETKLQTKRNEKKEILANSNLPAGIQMEDNDISINGLPLRETQISETTVKLAITEIACQISEAKLIDGGSASDYGHERLKQVAAIAAKYNKLLILEKVDDDLPDIRVVGYVEDK